MLYFRLNWILLGFFRIFTVTVVLFSFTLTVSALNCQQLDSGYYQLDSNITSNTTCFEVISDYVTLDGKGHSIKGGGLGNAIVISGVSNITLKNVTLENWDRGVVIENSTNVTLIQLNVTKSSVGLEAKGSSILLNDSRIAGNGRGLVLNSSTGLIYNNYFNSSENVEILHSTFVWNTSKRFGINVVEGPFLGGNFWAKPDGTGVSQTCADNDKDGVCDSPYIIDLNNTDYFPLTLWLSSPQPAIIVNEIHYNASNWQEEFVELYVWNDGGQSNINLSGYRITTFDDDEYILPDVSALDSYDIIAIYFGSGVSDLDASDGNATIYLNLGSSPLEKGDEVGLFSPDYTLLDFVRFEGGNGDKAVAGWRESDSGASQNSVNESIQLFGADFDSSENWASSPPTPAMPNVYATFIGGGAKTIPIYLQNGLIQDETITQAEIDNGEVMLISYNFSRGSGVNMSELNITRNMLNSSYSLFNNSGLNDPLTRSDGSILIRLTKNNRFNAAANQNGVISIDVGGDMSNSSIAAFLQWNVAHELFHLLEYQRINLDGTPSSAGQYRRLPVFFTGDDKYIFLADGGAEYWGLKAAMSSYGFPERNMFDISVSVQKQFPATFQSIDYNFSKMFRTLDINVPSLGTGTSNVYYHGFLFSKYVVAEFGENKLKDIHLKSRDRIGGSSPEELKGRKLLENVTGRSLENLWSDYRIWIYDNYRDKFHRNIWTFNGTLNSKINFSSSINPWGTDVAKIGLSVPQNSTVVINFNQTSSTKDDFNVTAVLIKGNTKKYVSEFANNSNVSMEFDRSNYDRVDLIITRFRDVSGTSALNYLVTAGYSHFEFSNLTLDKTEIKERESVKVSVDVKNNGTTPSTSQIEFKVDGNVTQTKNVTLNPGQSKKVNFTATFNVAGNYSLAVESLPPKNLTVIKVITPPPGSTPGDYIWIEKPGVYKLYSNLTGYGIRINTSNVIIDGQGYTINTTGYSFTSWWGTIWAESGPSSYSNPSAFKGVENIVIRNLNVEGGNIRGNISSSRFENIRVNVANPYSSAAYGLELMENNIVRNSEFSKGFAGIVLNRDGNLIDSVKFSENGRDVLLFHYSQKKNKNIIQNSIFNSSSIGISIQGTDILIQNNTFNGEDNAIMLYGLSSGGKTTDSNVVIANNVITGGGIGIYGANNTIENNVIKDSQHTGLTLGGSSFINNRIVNNTISNHFVYGIYVDGGYGNYIAGNNISYNSYYTVYYGYGFPIYGSYSAVYIKSADNTVFDGNTFFSNYDTDIMFSGSTDSSKFNRDVIIKNSRTVNNTRILNFDPINGYGSRVYFWNIVNTSVENHQIDPSTRISLYDFRNVSMNAVQSPPADPSDYRSVGKYVEFGGIYDPLNTSKLLGFSPATLGFHYNESELSGYSELALKILHYNSTVGIWIPITTVIDSGTNIARANVTEPGIYALMVQKNATVPQIAVSKTLIDFGNVTAGNSTSKTLIVSNNGSGDLTINSISITGSTDFSVSLSAPLLLSPGTSVSATITFSPTSAGAKNATLTISSNDPANPSVNVALQGYGKRYLPDFYLTMMNAIPSQLRENETILVYATVFNGGNRTLTQKVNVSQEILTVKSTGIIPIVNTTTLWKLVDMNGKSQVDVEFNFTAKEEGNHSLTISVDEDQRFDEINESNNWISMVIYVMPNESVKPVINVAYPDPVDAGEAAKIAITIVEEHPDTYEVRRNGTVISSGKYEDGKTFNVTIDTSKPGTFLYEITARDRAENSNTTSFTISVVDAKAPEIELLSPADNAKLFKSDVTLAFRVSDDFSTSLGYEVLVDGAVVKSANGYGSISIVVKPGDGSHTWGVRATDDYGNMEAQFRNFTVTTKVKYPKQSIPKMGSNDIHKAKVNSSEDFENETAITGIELVVKARSNTTPVNISVEAYTEPPAGINGTNDTVTGFYLNVTSDDSSWYANVSHITVRVYYNYSVIKDMLSARGINESDLRLLRYTNGKWVKLEAGKTLSDGTVVFDAGAITHDVSANPNVWANVSRLSVYGIGFEIPPSTPPSSPPSQSASQPSSVSGGTSGGYIVSPTPSPTPAAPAPQSTTTPAITVTPTPSVTETPLETPGPNAQETPEDKKEVNKDAEKTPLPGVKEDGGIDTGLVAVTALTVIALAAAGIYIWRKQ